MLKTTPDPFGPKPDPFGLPANFTLPKPEEIDASAAKAEQLHAAFSTLGDDIEARISKRGEELLANYSDGLAGLGMSPAEMAAVNKANEARVEKETTRFREGLLEHLGNNLNDQLRQLSEVKERVDGFLRVYPSPQALLGTQHLADPARTQYQNVLAHAGHAQLQTMARLAISTNNRALAAAVQTRIDTLPRDDRPFAAAEFAEKIVGTEWKKFKMAADKVNHAYQSVVNRQIELKKGKPFAHGRLTAALRAKAIADAEGTGE
ncbi:MAG TPA: hypothetical protein VF624_13795 [Tepidisphaeraceae bacterium]|jgi:hypothetical protein